MAFKTVSITEVINDRINIYNCSTHLFHLVKRFILNRCLFVQRVTFPNGKLQVRVNFSRRETYRAQNIVKENGGKVLRYFRKSTLSKTSAIVSSVKAAIFVEELLHLLVDHFTSVGEKAWETAYNLPK